MAYDDCTDGNSTHSTSAILRSASLPILFCTLMLGLAACRVEHPNPIPTPTPTPTPNPFPTPTPIPTPTPTPTPSPTPLEDHSSGTSSVTMGLSEAAFTNAEIVEESSSQMVAESGSFLKTVSNLSNDAGGIAAAVSSLENTRTAYLRAEAATLYPGVEEDESTGAVTTENRFTYLASLLDSYASLPENPYVLPKLKYGGDELLAALQAESNMLDTELQQFSSKWTGEDPANFRNQEFLPSPEAAVGSIFEGVINLSGSILANGMLANSGTVSPQIEGIRNFLLGTTVDRAGNMMVGTGIVTLLEQEDPTEAQSLREMLDRALILSQSLGISPEASEAALNSVLWDLREQTINAADSLGYDVEEDLPAAVK